MSGGAYNYVCFMDADELIGHQKNDDLKDIMKAFRKYGHPKIADDIKELMDLAEEMGEELSKRIESLTEVMRAVEWYESGDTSKKQMIDEFWKYYGIREGGE